MAVHMAAGLLFLGGGALTLGTSNSAVAALVCAFFPKFPSHSSDNRYALTKRRKQLWSNGIVRYHLQAFRHLYALAVEPRVLEAVDVDTRQSCYVPLEIALYPSTDQPKDAVLRTVAPCLIPELDRVKSIRVSSPRYWESTFQVKKNLSSVKTIRRHGVVFVKRKAGYLSYEQGQYVRCTWAAGVVQNRMLDPASARSILSRSFPKASIPLVDRSSMSACTRTREVVMQELWASILSSF